MVMHVYTCWQVSGHWAGPSGVKTERQAVESRLQDGLRGAIWEVFRIRRHRQVVAKHGDGRGLWATDGGLGPRIHHLVDGCAEEEASHHRQVVKDGGGSTHSTARRSSRGVADHRRLRLISRGPSRGRFVRYFYSQIVLCKLRPAEVVEVRCSPAAGSLCPFLLPLPVRALAGMSGSPTRLSPSVACHLRRPQSAPNHSTHVHAASR